MTTTNWATEIRADNARLLKTLRKLDDENERLLKEVAELRAENEQMRWCIYHGLNLSDVSPEHLELWEKIAARVKEGKSREALGVEHRATEGVDAEKPPNPCGRCGLPLGEVYTFSLTMGRCHPECVDDIAGNEPKGGE